MSAAQLIEKYLSLPESLRKELDRFVETLLQKKQQTPDSDSALLADLDLAHYNEPLDPDEFALSQKDLKAMQDVWEGEEDAETLCQFLTA